MRNLILVLGDQLSPALSSLTDFDPLQDVILMAEVRDEGTYVRHHKTKIALILSAMRHFAEDLQGRGWTIDYATLEDAENTQSLEGELTRAVARHAPEKVILTEPGEWRLAEQAYAWGTALPLEIREDTRFVASHDEFNTC